MNARDYIASEQFIHDDLLRRAEQVVQRLPAWWRRDGHVRPVLLCWPGEPVQGSDGTTIDDVCALDLTNVPIEARTDAITQMIARTRAYGLFFVEQLPGAVRAVFETRHGSRGWERRIFDHGGVLVLEDAVMTENVPGFGLRG